MSFQMVMEKPHSIFHPHTEQKFREIIQTRKGMPPFCLPTLHIKQERSLGCVVISYMLPYGSCVNLKVTDSFGTQRTIIGDEYESHGSHLIVLKSSMFLSGEHLFELHTPFDSAFEIFQI